MNVRLYLSLSEIEKRVNQSFGDVLFEGEQPDGSGLFSQVKVQKLSPIIIHAIDASLLSTTSVHVDLNMKIQEAGILDLLQDLSGFQRLSFDLRVSIQTQLTISPEGKLDVQSQARYQWEKKPRLGISILKVNISGMVQPILEKQLAAVAVEIDQYIQQEVQLETRIHEAWQLLQQTICIEENFPAWLNLEVGSGRIGISDWLYEKERLGIAIRLPIVPTSFLGEMPTPKPIVPLPFLSRIASKTDHTAFALKSQISYAGLAQFISGKEYISGDSQNSIFINTIQFSAQGKWLVSEVEFNGKFSWRKISRKVKGRCKLKAELLIDPDSKELRLDQLTYELEKVGVANRLLNRMLYRKVCRYLEASLNQLLKAEWLHIHTQVEQTLKAYPIHTHLLLKGAVNQFVPESIQLQKEAIELIIQMDWNAVLHLQHLDANIQA